LKCGPQATGETDYRPLPHKEQKMDRECEGFYMAAAAGADSSVAWLGIFRTSKSAVSRQTFPSIWLLMIPFTDRKRMTLQFCGD
jgi:hypothetical protein